MCRYGPSAHPHLVVTHYPELLASKGIVLARGDIVQPHSLDALAATSLMANCHEFYVDRGAKSAFVNAFNHRQTDFGSWNVAADTFFTIVFWCWSIAAFPKQSFSCGGVLT